MKIALDINGNDNGPLAAYEAAIDFCKNHPNDQIILIGDIDKITNKVNDLQNLTFIKNIETLEDMHNLRANLRKNTSMNQAINMLKTKEVDAVLSCGDSGNYISSLTLNLGRIKNVSRPSFMPMAKTAKGKRLLVLDVGANIEVKPEYLYQWALIANIYFQKLYNVKNPKVTILNIGTEEYKGPSYLIEAANLIKENKKINYIGFSESRSVLNGDYDIALCDGYAGNHILKSYEGALLLFKNLIKNFVKDSFIAKIGALLMKPVFKKVAKTIDYKSVAAAWVVGVDGLAMKTHGASDKQAFSFALEQLQIAHTKNIYNEIKNEMENIDNV